MLEQLVECLLVADDVIRGRQFGPGIGELHRREVFLFSLEFRGITGHRQTEVAEVLAGVIP